MNREDLDACTNRPTCTAKEHVTACPSDKRRRAYTAEIGDHAGDWVVYDYDNGPYAIALYANAEGAARHAARQGYGRVGFWPFGTELREAIATWEGRPLRPPPRPAPMPNPVVGTPKQIGIPYVTTRRLADTTPEG